MTIKEQKLYECILITTHNEIDNILVSTTDGLEGKNAGIEKNFSVLNKEFWGKRNLAYKINKNKKGYYSAIYISATPKTLEAFNKKLRMHQDVIRFMILAIDRIPHLNPPIMRESEKLNFN